jgi:hypothetical protein
MSIIHVNHIQSSCKSRFETLIDISDVTGRSDEDRENHFLTRALSAFSIAATAKIDDVTAAACVVDEPHDDGIDAFYFDRIEHVGYLAQSKWCRNGTTTIDLASSLKFVHGINHFLQGEIKSLGPKLQAKENEIQDLLGDSRATFVLIIAYTGRPEMAAEVQKPLDDLLAKLNDDEPWVSLQVQKQKELHRVVEQLALGDAVDLTVMLHEWGKVREPHMAYYGQINVADIAAWGKFGDHLYHKNIRSFKGSTEVNDAIATTLRDKPENFLYFNNGITLLCSALDKQPLGGTSRTSGVFDCRGASVVNGAQTVGSIINMASVPDNARVMVRLISLDKCPSDFASDVTRATNTQNRIEKRDFAALDPEQARLQSDMLLSLGKEYVFRTGDLPPAPENGCTLDDAAVALACANPDINYCMVSKREVSKLYDDIKQPPYTAIFNPSLTALKLWRAVMVYRAVEAFLKVSQSQVDGRLRLIVVHGNRLVLHLLFKKLPRDLFDKETVEEEIASIPHITAGVLSELQDEIAERYSSSYPASLFKNTTKCKALAASIG